MSEHESAGRHTYGFSTTRNQAVEWALSKNSPTLNDAQGSNSVEAWFMGPRGENGDIVERLIVEAIRDQIYWRRNYHPSDPSPISADKRISPEYVTAISSLEDG
jgi:hypothetical protein